MGYEDLQKVRAIVTLLVSLLTGTHEPPNQGFGDTSGCACLVSLTCLRVWVSRIHRVLGRGSLGLP